MSTATDSSVDEAPIDEITRPAKGATAVAVSAGLTAAAVALALGIYGSVHHPTGRNLPTVWFETTRSLKSWLTTAAVALMVVQVSIGSWMHHTKKYSPPPRHTLVEIHRLIGTVAFALTLPVVFHCLWSLGFQSSSTRVLIHSLAGTAAYGAYAAKILLARQPISPRWSVPAVGTLVLVLFATAWWSS